MYLDSMFESGGSRRASKADWIYSFFALTLVVLFFHPVRPPRLGGGFRVVACCRRRVAIMAAAYAPWDVMCARALPH